MEINEKQILLWSKLGSRATYGLTILELAKKIENNLLVITADTSTSAGLERFKKKYPENYFDVGIAEQNSIGIAAGLASENFTVFSSTFTPFQTMRCLEQIKVNLCYMNIPVNLVGLASGVVLGDLGYTHCSIEDISVMRSFPNMTVLSPADCGETAKAVFAAAEYNKPVYIRLTGGTNNAIVYKNNYNFQIGKAIKLVSGEDIALVATGTMVSKAINAVKELNEKSIFPSVYNFHTIKPIDEETIKYISNKYKLIITIEEHNVIGGLGSAVAEKLIQNESSIKQVFMGIKDNYSASGNYETILNKTGLTKSNIINKIMDNIQN